MKCFPFHSRRRLGQATLRRMHVQPDRPKLGVKGLSELEFIHPMTDLSRVDIEVYAALEELHQWRADGVAQVQQGCRPTKALAEFSLRHAVEIKAREVLQLRRLPLVEQNIVEPIMAHALVKNANATGIESGISGSRHEFQPKIIHAQALQSQRPLQGHGKVATALGILRRKSTAQENRARVVHNGGKS